VTCRLWYVSLPSTYFMPRSLLCTPRSLDTIHKS
jgi:hypothetical protein